MTNAAQDECPAPVGPPRALCIGPFRPETPVFLAPMAGYTDLPFRLEVRALGGVGLAYTPLLNPFSLLRGGGKQRKALLATTTSDAPLGYQIYGTDPALLSEAAGWLESRGALLIDLNMGCPQRKISARGAGAGLLKSPAEAVKLAGAVAAAVRVPVTVKLRLGWDRESLVAHSLVTALEDVGVAAITVHGRTGGQGYTGTADVAEMRKVVAAARRVPVIANGDVVSVAAARRLFAETGCAGIMVGRGILTRPWLIRDIARDLRGAPPLPAPTPLEMVAFACRHVAGAQALYGPENGVLLYRKWIPLYLRPLLRDRPEMVRWLQLTQPAALAEALESLALRL